MLGEGFSWLLRGELDEILVTLKKMYVGFSSDIVLAEDNGTMYDVYKLTSTTELQVRLLEEFRFRSKRNRYNLEQNALRGAFVFTTFKVNNETSHLILDKYYYPQDEKINRMYYAFFMYLSKIFNFTLDILVSETYGYRSENGTFNGEIRDLILTRADFGMSAIGITNERLNAVDFTANIDDVYFLVIFIEEKAFGGYKALIQPFSSKVWIGLLIIIVAAIVVSSVPQSLNTVRTALANGSMLIVSVMCSQGLTKEFPGSYKKGLCTVLLFFSMIVTIFYHTSIMNGLLSPTPNLIKTVEDVVAKKRIGVANISYLTPLFLHPLVVQKLNEVREKRYEIPMGIKKVQQDKMFSLIGDEKTLREAMERSFTDSDKCNGREIRAGSKIQIATPIKKHSHYKEMIIFGLVYIHFLYICKIVIYSISR
ncbi:unnamed protein product [Nezara viridula]|uniref:Ionotropic glutamate receptor L-glutamate and glycine-binding domain-containing protein n=1 Tax=Nezara viridula TaxID=85310 RepID=A0A9P0EE25_NEZVI|nr:unnamed protein product [Nezara viridula]